MGKLDGKVALVTGAGGGLGRAYALLLAKQGAKVVVNDLGGSRDGSGQSSSMADAVVAEIREAGGEAIANYGSVADVEGAQAMVDDAVQTFGRLDVVINNAGILRDKTLVKMDEAMWDLVMDVHAKGTFLVTQAAVRYMIKAGHGGSIVNTSSYAGLKGNFGQANYATAKAGIAGFTRTVALETRKFKITCNAIAPMAKTRMTTDISMIPEEMKPEQIAPLVVWLATEEAKDVTGRIFGAHGSHYLEYQMEMTPGVDLGNETWTFEQISERLSEICRPAWKTKQGADGGASRAEQNVRALFEALPSVYKAEGARGWTAKIVFEVKGTGDYSLVVGEGGAEFKDGPVDSPDGKVTFDAGETLLDLASGKIAAQQAFMAGKITTTNMGVLMNFAKYFDLEEAGRRAAGGGAGGEAPAQNSERTKSEGLNVEAVGKKFKHPARFIKPEEIVAYAEATEDHNPRYTDATREGGIVASPIFAVQPLFAVLGDALTDKELNADLMRLVHGEQEMRFYSPLKPWDLVAPRGEISSIEEKSSGHLVNVRQMLMRDGDLVVEATSGLFIKGGGRPKDASAQAGPQGGAPKEAPAPRESVHEATQPVAEDQSLRYAEASGDRNPIHIDPKIARAAGLDGIILHGLCTMAMATKAFVDGVLGGDPGSLKRIKVRFAKPVFPGNTLTTRIWKEGEGVYGLETVNQDGVPVLTHGVVEVG